jgi:hypothetical protein
MENKSMKAGATVMSVVASPRGGADRFAAI